jgi:4-amino-4-deoxy-L-arabinose transferase-like glycosyltransferase
MDEGMADQIDFSSRGATLGLRTNWYPYLVILLFSAAIYLGCIVSPPSLMDDVDAVQGQIARNMLTSGDWVTARVDGIAYLEKSPLVYWAMAISYKIFGVHDWSARIPIALSAIALCLVTAAFGVWAFGKRAGFYAGLCLATCVGLFLFTRILIPDVMLTCSTALSMWAFLRAIDDKEPHPRLWVFLLGGSLGIGLLLKSLIAIVFPIGTAVIYLLVTHQLFSREIWKRLHPFTGALILLLIAGPWYVLATVRNPPYFAFTLQSGPGQYHGFLWFFFINEQLLRFLNRRFPHDYNTVPRLYFWLFHLIWLFPWSVYFPAVAKLSFKPIDRAGRTRLLALCWAGFVLVFFTFSTTQEYYSMPCYPALALLLGSAMAANGDWVRRGTRALGVISACAALAAFAIYWDVRNLPAPGDISQALSNHPSAYTLSLGHIRLPASSAHHRHNCYSPRRDWKLLGARFACIPCRCGHDGSFSARCPHRYGGFRPLPILEAPGRGASSVARRFSNYRPPLLPVFFHLFLYEPNGTASKRQSAEPRVRFQRAGRAQCVH